MAKVSYVRHIKDTHLLRLGIVEEGEKLAFTVSEKLCFELSGFSAGEELDEYTLERIKREDEYYNAKKKALSLLAYTDNNELTLIRKLRARKISADVAEEIAREMVTLGYINEERQLERIILNEANVKKYGPRKIIQRLASKGYKMHKIKEVLSCLTSSREIDFAKNAQALIEKNLCENYTEEEQDKLLFKYGYKA